MTCLEVCVFLICVSAPGFSQLINNPAVINAGPVEVTATSTPQGFVEVVYKDFPIPNDVTLNCKCVRFYLCDDDDRIVTTGENVIDIRIDGSADVWNVQQCPDVTMRCCQLPPGVTPPPRLQPNPEKVRKCGVRQGSAIDSLLRIKDGEETEFGEFPWMLAMMSAPVMPNGGVLNVFACGASLIHPRVALTAAHCVTTARKSFPNVRFKVRAGEWDTNTTEELLPYQDQDVEKVVMHPRFNKGTLVNDIALLVLAHPLELAENVGTICLPEQGDQFLTSNCVATGWGREAFDSQSPYQTVLRKVDLHVTASAKCQEDLRKTKVGTHFQLNRSFVCAVGRSGEDTCKGDGGGPLVCPSPHNPDHYVQVGIVSWGVGCGNGTPAVYTDVSFQRAWINEKLQQEGIFGQSAPTIPRRK